MKRFLSLLLLVCGGLPAVAADIGVSIGINQPGVYGRIDIGRVPTPPVLVYERPMVIVQNPVAVQRQPIYLHVPPGHARDWRRHCGRYQACGQPVYFVQDRWYRDSYAPRVQVDRPRYGDDHRGDRRDDHRGDRKHPHKGDKHGHDGGKHGRGHDKHGRD